MREHRTKSDLEHIVGWIRRSKRREFSKRELYQATKNRFARADDLDALRSTDS